MGQRAGGDGFRLTIDNGLRLIVLQERKFTRDAAVKFSSLGLNSSRGFGGHAAS